MAGRIRTIKPEILEDEKCAALTHLEFRLFVGSWLIADDYGNLRGDPDYIRGQIVWASRETRETVAKSLDTLARVSLLVPYTVRGQSYLHVAGWKKHQKVDKPGKPRMPGPQEADCQSNSQPVEQPQEVREDLCGVSRDCRETLATDLRPPTSDRESLPRAIPLSTEQGPEPVQVPAMSPPAPACEDFAGTQPGAERAAGRYEPASSARSAAAKSLLGDQPLIPPGESAWHRRMRWWGVMLEADRRLRAAGIEPDAPSLPKAPAGTNELNMNRCERQLLDGGATPDEVDAKMRHIVLVAEAEALRGDNRSRRWFKPALIWDPERAARAVDTSLDEANRERAGPIGSAARAPEQPPARRVMTIKPRP